MAEQLPVVFVHGIRLSGACWCQQERLPRGRPVGAPDLPGHGTRQGERFTMDGAVDAVAESIERVGGRAVLVGHSLGGFVAIAAAARHPDRVAALIGAGCSIVPTAPLCAGFKAANRVLERVPASAPWSFPRLLRRVLPAEIADPVLAAGVAYEVTTSALVALTAMDPLGEIARYPGNVLLLNGRHDHFRLGEGKFLSTCRNGALRIIPGAGHYAPLTHGAEFGRAVEEVARLAKL